MYLKSLVLKGFKSFADRSVMAFEPGITSVVGPNGSGKSNISDAVLWVLGERNAKNLRGQAMEDVIFAGSSARKSLGIAEVDLVLDNTDGTLPVDFAEVSLTRRMYRSGESEYLINGAPARRMDFMDILHDTGLGTGTHSIIGQGNLDAILASRPEDRRTLIEEAAGVLKHKQRKDRSARKLAAMDAHLDRVKDVTAEIERQLKPLARKAQRAQAYQGLSSELSELELVLAVDDLRLLQRKWDETAVREKEAAASIDLAQFNADEAEKKLEKLQVMLQEKGLYVGDLTAQRGRFHMALERFESSDMLLGEKGRGIRSRLDQARSSFAANERRMAQFEEEANALRKDLDEKTALRDALESNVADLEKEFSEAKDARTKMDAELSEVQSLLRSREREMESAVAKRSELKDGLAGRLSSKALLETRRRETKEEFDAASCELRQRCLDLDEDAAELTRLFEESRKASEELAEAQRALASAADNADAARQELRRIEARIAALEEVNKSIREKNEISAWISAHAASFDATSVPLSSQVKAPRELEPLVEMLLGDDLSSPVVADGACAARFAREASSCDASGSASILFSESARRASERPQGRLLESLAYPDSIASLMEELLGDYVVVDTLDEPCSRAGACDEHARYVALDGTVFVPGAKLVVRNGFSNDSGVLARERELESLRASLAQAVRALSDAESCKQRSAEELERKRAMSLELSQAHAQRKGANKSAEAERQRLAKRVGVLEATLASLATQLRQTEEQLSEVQPRIEELSTVVDSCRVARTELEEHLSSLNGNRAMLFDKEQALQSRLSDAKLNYSTTKERVLSLMRETKERERDLDRARRSFERAQKDIATLETVEKRIGPLHDTLSSLKESVKRWVDDLASKAALEQSNSAELTEAISAARGVCRECQERLDASRSFLNDVRIEKGRLEVQVEAAVSAIVNDCGVALETALEIPAPEDREKAEGEAFRLRRKLSSMGTIDSSASEEYEAMKERYDFMVSQVEDVEAARRALRRIVSAIDARMKEQFDVTFERVNENFQEIFGQLFPGGSGSLELVNVDDPDHLGVEVHAQPRGKRIAKMTLMSGGEKSLTAIALLFAVYRIRKTPFYILDEVEAALDDSNLRRLLAYLETLRFETQLIMITHQRRTMELSDVLYGVSMQSDGVTKVVSQKLDQARSSARA